MNRRLRQQRNLFLMFLGGIYVSLMSALPIVTAAASKMPPRAAPSAEQHAFAHLDRDGDGFINRYEAAAFPALDEIFNDADRRPDGRLDRAEYARGLALIAGKGRP